MKCEKGHKYEVKPSHFKRGNRCLFCQGRHPSQARDKFFDFCSGQGYSIMGEYKNSAHKVKILCSKGHSFEIYPRNTSFCQTCKPLAGRYNWKNLNKVDVDSFAVVGLYLIILEGDNERFYKVGIDSINSLTYTRHGKTTGEYKVTLINKVYYPLCEAFCHEQALLRYMRDLGKSYKPLTEIKGKGYTECFLGIDSVDPDELSLMFYEESKNFGKANIVLRPNEITWWEYYSDN